jgi:chemotaxis protein MotB
MRTNIIPILTLTLVLLTSCVSQQKYTDLETAHNRLAERLSTTQAERDDYQREAGQLQIQLNAEQARIKELTADLATARQRYTDLDAANRDLLARYDRVLEQNKNTLAAAGDENATLVARLNEKERELDQRQRELQRLQQELITREARVAELEKAIADKDARLRAIRDKVNQALLGFSEADLTVTEKNGKIYVSLSQNLLFASGSKTINAQGKKAINQLATVLKANKDINITVEGHTDTDGEAAFNWDLSVGRATTVVKELTTNGLAPERIIAAGRGEFYPVASNDTATGKAQNRRTEIILTPKLEGLYDLLGQ